MIGQAVAVAGAPFGFRTARAWAGTPDPKVFEGREVFDRLLGQARERR